MGSHNLVLGAGLGIDALGSCCPYLYRHRQVEAWAAGGDGTASPASTEWAKSPGIPLLPSLMEEKENLHLSPLRPGTSRPLPRDPLPIISSPRPLPLPPVPVRSMAVSSPLLLDCMWTDLPTAISGSSCTADDKESADCSAFLRKLLHDSLVLRFPTIGPKIPVPRLLGLSDLFPCGTPTPPPLESDIPMIADLVQALRQQSTYIIVDIFKCLVTDLK
jgi:hypothetical protein